MPNALESLAEQILNDVLELPPAEWSAAAHRACGGDADLHSRVCNLLRAFTTAGKFLLDPTVVSAADGLLGSNATHEVVEQPGDAVGPYTLLERIGEGGSGVVFMARHDGAVHPLVALKIIKPSRDAVARFDAEREALSMMDHPGIVKLLDSGTTPRGRPYLVMELVSRVRRLQNTRIAANSRSAIGWRWPFSSAGQFTTRTITGSCTGTSSPATSWR